MSWAEAYAVKKEQFRRTAQKDILAFTLYTKSDYEVNWHHKAIAKKLNAWIVGDIRFLMIFMAPRHGKSELVSRRLPAFLHGVYPDCEIMAASYLDSLAADMTIDIQKIIDSKEYAEIFPETKIHPIRTPYNIGTRNSTEHHIVGRRGKYRGQGVGGSFTGRGAAFILVDDPIKGREIADSEAFRDRLWNFYNNDLFSRLETNLKTGRQGQILVTQTRWHENDLSGRLIDLMKADANAVQWDIVSYPAIREDRDDPSDPRAIGEALWSAKYNLQDLEQIRSTIGARAWGSLYQQEPCPQGGALFKDEMFEFVKPPQSIDWGFITSDTAYKEKQEHDFSCFAAWGVVRDQLFLREVWMQHIKASDMEAPAEAFIQKYLAYGYRGTYIEPKGHGIYLNQIFSKRNLMIPSEEKIKEFYQDRRQDKVERANNVIPHLAYRKIYINENIPIKEQLVTQCIRFPKVRHDDFVDCLIDALKIVYTLRKPSLTDVIYNQRKI